MIASINSSTKNDLAQFVRFSSLHLNSTKWGQRLYYFTPLAFDFYPQKHALLWMIILLQHVEPPYKLVIFVRLNKSGDRNIFHSFNHRHSEALMYPWTAL